MIEEFLQRVAPLFTDRTEAGKELAVALAAERGADTVVVGLAKGGIAVAAEVARNLRTPLDVVVVERVVHPRLRGHVLGAVTADGVSCIRTRDGLHDRDLARAVAEAAHEARRRDARLHAVHERILPVGKTVVVVDDGLATGASVLAVLRWAKSGGAARVVAAVPVAAAESLEPVATEADEVVCPHPLSPFVAVRAWYARFEPLDDAAVVHILAESRRDTPG